MIVCTYINFLSKFIMIETSYTILKKVQRYINGRFGRSFEAKKLAYYQNSPKYIYVQKNSNVFNIGLRQQKARTYKLQLE